MAGLARFLGWLRQGMAAALQWHLILWWLGVTALPALLLGIPLVSALDGQLDNALHAADWSRDQTVLLASDLAYQLRETALPLAGAGAVAGLLLLLLVPLLNAMFIAAARAPAPLQLGELLRGAVANYWRMVRLAVFALIPLGIALGLAALLMKAVHRYDEHAILEADVQHLRWLALAAGALLYAWASACVDAARAWLALHPTRRSAFQALWRGAKLVVRHPLRGIGLYLGIAVPALVLVLLAAALRLAMSTAGDGGMLGGLLLTQGLVAITAWMHYARQFAMLAWLREMPDA
jgi:hypothetical protein